MVGPRRIYKLLSSSFSYAAFVTDHEAVLTTKYAGIVLL